MSIGIITAGLAKNVRGKAKIVIKKILICHINFKKYSALLHNEAVHYLFLRKKSIFQTPCEELLLF